MSYQALYRVFRPQTFSEMSGQKTITQTLKNAVKTGNTSHAYLFTGPRGTGKTSAAKIFSKAINCENQSNGDPCNECAICKQITNGTLGDVIEIDAASNNGVEEIRDIREKANYAPTQADYKVYIIDEVHMLSMGAFNALLKTLEEPPTNVIFILATTEPHKIPLTIISRTQRFDFKRITSEDIINRMEYILKDKNENFEDDALRIIANAAGGGMRDALSLLDQAISFSNDGLKVSDALQITGSITQDKLLTYLGAVQKAQAQEGLSILADILADGKDASRFVEDAILMLRDIVLFQMNSKDRELLKIARVNNQFESLASEFKTDFAFYAIEILNQTQMNLKTTNHADIYLEVATVKLSKGVSQLKLNQTNNTQANEDSNELIKQVNNMSQKVKDMEKKMQEGPSNVSTAQAKPSTKRRKPKDGFNVNIKAIHEVLENATGKDLDQLKDLWEDLINSLDDSHRGIMRNSRPVAASPSALVVTFEYDILCEKAESDELLQEAIGNFLDKVIGHRPRLVCVPEEKWPGIRKDFIKEYKARKQGSGDQEITEEQDENDDQETSDNQIIDKAFEIFGKDNVEIKE